MSVPTRSWASVVAAPMCGVATTRGCFARRQSFGGSLRVHVEGGARHPSALEGGEQRLVVDQLAAGRVHDADPGLDLRRTPPCRAGAGVSLVRVVCRVRKSELGQDLVEGPQLHVDRLGHRRARRTGRRPATSMPKARQRAATSRPIRPRPMTPEALAVQLDSGEGLAVPLLGLHRGVGGRRCCGRGRGAGDSASSAVETRLPPGEFMTMTPRRVAAARSTLSTPTPGRPMTFRLFAASSTSAVIWLPLRMSDRVVGRDDLDQLRRSQRLLDVDRPAFGPQDLEAAVGNPLEDENLVAQIKTLARSNDVMSRALAGAALAARQRPRLSPESTPIRNRCAADTPLAPPPIPRRRGRDARAGARTISSAPSRPRMSIAS